MREATITARTLQHESEELPEQVFRWIKEDTSEVFQQVARETAGFDKAADNV